jgi:hypothetical protein
MLVTDVHNILYQRCQGTFALQNSKKYPVGLHKPQLASTKQPSAPGTTKLGQLGDQARGKPSQTQIEFK